MTTRDLQTLDAHVLAAVSGGLSLDLGEMHRSGKRGAAAGAVIGAPLGGAVGAVAPAVVMTAVNPLLTAPVFEATALPGAAAGAVVGAATGGGLGYVAGAGANGISQVVRQLRR